MPDPLDERNIPPVNYKSLEWRMYNTLYWAMRMICSYRPPTPEEKQKIRDTINGLLQEYEERKFNDHRERN